MDEVDEPLRQAYDPAFWPPDHRVLEAFVDAALEVRNRKFEGTGIAPSVASKAEEAFLRSALASLTRARLPANARDAHDERWDEMGVIGASEIDAIDIREWADPVVAVLYAAVQAAAHDGMRGSGPMEPNLNQIMLSAIRAELAKIVKAYERSGATLPPGKFLHGGVVSMQEGGDLMGADLAVVVGTNVGGLARYRVVLLQGKHEADNARNRADVRQGGGQQLKTLLSSRMGYYLFYPRPVAHHLQGGGATRLMPVVRSAVDVARDVGTQRRRGRYRVNCYTNRRGEVDATDFAQFVSIVMTGGSRDVGQLFCSAAEVVDALTTPDRPLVPAIVAIDRTGLLLCHELLKGLENRGYDVLSKFRLPSSDELTADHEHAAGEVSPRTRFGGYG